MRLMNMFIPLMAGCTYSMAPQQQVSGSDGPGYTLGDPGTSDQPVTGADQDKDGHVSVTSGGDDCNDGRADIHPGATESPDCDGIDADCDGEDRSDLYRSSNDCGADDDDGDGVFEENERGDTVDCDDGDADVFPGAGFNEEDEDDAAACCQDHDGDGYCDDNITSSQEDDGVMEGSDCSDTDADIHPGAADDDANGIDDDCDGEVDSEGSVGGGDFDDDDCDGWSEEQGDCDDDDDHVFPFACYNEEDSDVFLGCGRDDDEDGWCDDSVSNDEEDDGMVEGEDCDDEDDNVYPDDDGDCVDNGSSGGSGGTNNDGILYITVTSDSPARDGSTPSWELWAANASLNIWEWPGFSPRYSGTSTTGSVTGEIAGNSGDYVYLNGAYDEGHAWLVSSSSTVIDSITVDGHALSIYASTMDDTPNSGQCTHRVGHDDLVCLVP